MLASQTALPLATRKASVKEVLYLSFPIILSMISMAALGIIDTLFMGYLGSEAQAAVGFGAPALFGLLAFFFGVLAGLTTFVSQFFGAQKNADCGHMLWHALYLAVMTGVLINFILRPFLPTILDLVNTNPQIVQPVLEYMDVRLMASPWVFVSFGLVSFLRGLGDMKTPAIVSIVIILINVPLTYAFVFGFGPIPAMGVKGAAISTIIAQGIECLMYFAVVLNRKNHAKYKTRRLVHPSLSTYKKYLSLSLPVGVAWGLEQTGWLVFGFYIASLSKEAAAANAIVYQFMGFAFMFALAFSIATTTLVGQYLGAKNQEAAKITATHSIRLSVVVLGILGVLFFLLRYPIANAFSSDTDVIQIAANLFIFGVVYQLFDALNIVSAGALRGAGDTRFPMIVMLGIIWCVLIPLVFVFGEVMQWGIYGAWTAASIAIIGMGIVFYIRFRRGKWLNIHIVS